jgi:putative transposase
MRKAYQTDLSDAEWSCLEPHLPTPKASGRPRIYVLREILDAVFYVLKSGCAWRLLPHDFPPWKTVYHYPSVPGVWTAPGRGCMPPCASVCESASTETLSPARP